MESTTQAAYISTNIGEIAVFRKHNISVKTPVIFFHGVYLDHHLWEKQVNEVNDRTVIAVDMPLHGSSREIKKKEWTLNDCAEMLIEILDSLQIPKIIAIGHSWGSMTILRAAYKHPERFAAVGLCNMPFLALKKSQKMTFVLQHSMLIFRNFYMSQAAKSLFGKTSLKVNPELANQLKRCMTLLSGREIKSIDKKVILDAVDAAELISGLKIKALALKGEEDYVPTHPTIETLIANGGHISPLEDPKAVSHLIQYLLNYN